MNWMLLSLIFPYIHIAVYMHICTEIASRYTTRTFKTTKRACIFHSYFCRQASSKTALVNICLTYVCVLFLLKLWLWPPLGFAR